MSQEIKSENSQDHKLKCGEIFYENRKIYFECTFCEKKFEQSQNNFIEHLDDHLNSLLDVPQQQHHLHHHGGNNITSSSSTTGNQLKIEDTNFEIKSEKAEEEEEDDDNDSDLENSIDREPGGITELPADYDQDDEDYTAGGVNVGDGHAGGDESYDDEDTEKLIGLAKKIRKSKDDGLYYCPTKNCKSSYNNLTSIRNHLKTKHPGRGSVEYPEVLQLPDNKMFPCGFRDCKHSEPTLDLIQRHMYDEHLPRLNKIEQFPCTKCERVYNLKSSLREHLKKRHYVIFDDGMIIIKEIRTFKSDKDNKYHCPKCDMKFAQRSGIRSHLKIKHEEYFSELLEKNKKIIVKPEGFNDDSAKPRVNPKELRISEADGLWHCPHCPEAKDTRRRLYLHIKTKHVDNTVCKVCGKKLASSTSLDIHMKWHGERLFKCEFCEKSFYNRSNMMSHVRMHLGQKNYQCSFCDKRFTNGSDKKVHEKMVHEKKKDYQCETCGKEFFRFHDLKKHKLRHTGERAFQCHICQKAFYESHHLKDHFKLHTDVKPFQCNLCDQKYARKGALQHHLKAHAKAKQQYNCEICGQKFMKNSDLTTHMGTHQYLQNFG